MWLSDFGAGFFSNRGWMYSQFAGRPTKGTDLFLLPASKVLVVLIRATNKFAKILSAFCFIFLVFYCVSLWSVFEE